MSAPDLLPIPGVLEAIGAHFSPDRVYRYVLWRRWDEAKGVVCWVMLNPSTADEHADDPTIRRCIGFARSWGYGAVVVVNLFGYRATEPAALPLVAYRTDIVGPENDAAIRRHAEAADLVVAAWGNHGSLHGRGAEVLRMLRPLAVHCLGTNGTGTPKHPLYLPSATLPVTLTVEEPK